MKPLVSILIPSYNAEEWIVDTVESALAQTWSRKEIVIVDDGSNDSTLALARRYESKHVCIVSQRNQGGAAARNTAFAHCQGDYIQWLDADDLLAPDKVTKKMAIAEQCADDRILGSSAWAYFMYRPSAARFAPTPLWDDLLPMEWMLRKWSHNVHMQTATWLVSRELSSAAGPWNTELLGDDDGEYFARVVLASRGVRFAPDARVFYRVVGTSRLSYIGRSNRKLEAHFRSIQLQIGHVRSLDDGPRVRAAIVNYLQTWLPHFYPERLDLVDEMRSLASAVGGELQIASIGGKYALIDMMLGRVAAKKAQLHYNAGKTFVLRSWDKLLFALAEERVNKTGIVRTACKMPDA